MERTEYTMVVGQTNDDGSAEEHMIFTPFTVDGVTKVYAEFYEATAPVIDIADLRAFAKDLLDFCDDNE